MPFWYVLISKLILVNFYLDLVKCYDWIEMDDASYLIFFYDFRWMFALLILEIM